MFPKGDIIFKTLVFGVIVRKLSKNIVVEVVNNDRIGCNHQLSDMIIHKLLKLGFMRILHKFFENGRNELFVEFFIADLDLVDDVQEKIFVGIVKNITQKEHILE
jgi:hypothetical protein